MHSKEKGDDPEYPRATIRERSCCRDQKLFLFPRQASSGVAHTIVVKFVGGPKRPSEAVSLTALIYS
jgi:hypothetical protein